MDILFTNAMKDPNDIWQLWNEVTVEEPPSLSAVALVSLDISAVFDTVSHRKLLARLKHDFSIDRVALEWINSYLS